MGDLSRVEKARRMELLEQGLKACTGPCGRVLSVDCFAKGDPSRWWQGLSPHCRECKYASSANWQKDNADKVAVKAKRFREDNPEVYQASKLRYEGSALGQQTKRARYIRTNYGSEAAYEAFLAEREAQRDVAAEARATSDLERAAGGAERAAYMRLYGSVISRLYRGYRRTVDGGMAERIDRIWPEALFAYWDARGIDPARCFYTGEVLGDDWHLEHKVPICRGGFHTVENLVPCSPAANNEKWDMTAAEYFSFLESKENVA